MSLLQLCGMCKQAGVSSPSSSDVGEMLQKVSISLDDITDSQHAPAGLLGAGIGGGVGMLGALRGAGGRGMGGNILRALLSGGAGAALGGGAGLAASHLAGQEEPPMESVSPGAFPGGAASMAMRSLPGIAAQMQNIRGEPESEMGDWNAGNVG